jgi:transposase-like protein
VYPLSYRHVEELMEECRVSVDHATIQRWVVKYSPQFEDAFHRRRRPVCGSWRLGETYRRVKGEWHSLFRAVDKQGQTIDFLLTAQQDKELCGSVGGTVGGTDREDSRRWERC